MAENNELMIKIDNVVKQYKLGEIGGTTLRDELQRLGARIKHKEDPTKKIGAKDYNKGEIFRALDGVSFTVKKGERVGIIGHNGAGKSTLLKLISRVTTPTEGEIGLNGRITSMLEVGTGFHGELTGRENIYMNGAILGMTKKEIDAKMEDIIEFSECRQFIDTPVKRYSSGMYVKLAFSVAAHLDSEIMIMDEVLAVGDMAFQKKCLDKMNDVSREQGRTILYVSHNMNTIRQLCDRVVVLDHGKVVFDGDVEEGISLYLNKANSFSLTQTFIQTRTRNDLDFKIRFQNVRIQNEKDCPIFLQNKPLIVEIGFNCFNLSNYFAIRWIIHSLDGGRVGMATTKSEIKSHEGMNKTVLQLPLDGLAPGKYYVDIVAYSVNEYGKNQLHDVIENAFGFEKQFLNNENNRMEWIHNWWGYVMFPNIVILNSNNV